MFLMHFLTYLTCQFLPDVYECIWAVISVADKEMIWFAKHPCPRLPVDHLFREGATKQSELLTEHAALRSFVSYLLSFSVSSGANPALQRSILVSAAPRVNFSSSFDVSWSISALAELFSSFFNSFGISALCF